MEVEKILARQLAMNGETWATLQEHGVREDTELRLDFSYNAPSHQAAEDLQALLREQTDYDLHVLSSGSLLSRKWRLEGTTQSTRISHAILDQWVRWMVLAGAEASCEFDGWGTEA
jgi:regulator of ribonuclease activity B